LGGWDFYFFVKEDMSGRRLWNARSSPKR